MHPGFRRRDVVAFVVSQVAEQRDAALVDQRACWPLLGTEPQLGDKMVKCGAKDPELNTALDKRESEQVDGDKRLPCPSHWTRQGQVEHRAEAEVVAPTDKVCGRADRPLLVSKGRRWTGVQERSAGGWSDRRTTSCWRSWAGR